MVCGVPPFQASSLQAPLEFHWTYADAVGGELTEVAVFIHGLEVRRPDRTLHVVVSDDAHGIAMDPGLQSPPPHHGD